MGQDQEGTGGRHQTLVELGELVAWAAFCVVFTAAFEVLSMVLTVFPVPLTECPAVFTDALPEDSSYF